MFEVERFLTVFLDGLSVSMKDAPFWIFSHFQKELMFFFSFVLEKSVITTQ